MAVVYSGRSGLSIVKVEPVAKVGVMNWPLGKGACPVLSSLPSSMSARASRTPARPMLASNVAESNSILSGTRLRQAVILSSTDCIPQELRSTRVTVAYVITYVSSKTTKQCLFSLLKEE